jgi:hypothetical protein
MAAGPRPPRFPTTASATTMSLEERRKLMAVYQASPEYQAFMKQRLMRPISAPIGPDGHFRLEDVPAGSYSLSVRYSSAERSGSGYLENIGQAAMPVTVAAMEGGRSEQALDVGEIKLVIEKRVMVGEGVPDLAGSTADGKTVKLSDYRGKYVLFCVSRYKNSNELADMARCNVIRDRYRDDPRLVMLTFNARSGPVMGGPTRVMGTVDWPVVEMNQAVPPVYASVGETIFLIDPAGKLVAKNLNAPAAVAKVDEALGAPAGAEGVKVAVSHLPVGTTEGTAYGNEVPAVSNHDAATNGTFSVVDGVGTEPSNSVDRLRDGRDCTGDDAPSQNFFFELGTLEGRLKLDLGKVISVGQVNSYSRHKSDRAPQVYVVYGSDGSGEGFEASPKIGTDPGAVGWKKVAIVDSRPKSGAVGGRYGVSVSNASGALGKFRYLLFEIFPGETRDPYGQGFYSEIDVVEGR